MRTSGWHLEQHDRANQILLASANRGDVDFAHLVDAFHCFTDDSGPTLAAAQRLADALAVVPAKRLFTVTDQVRQQLREETNRAAGRVTQLATECIASIDESVMYDPAGHGPTIGEIRRAGAVWVSSPSSGIVTIACILQALEWSMSRPSGPVVSY